MKQDARAPSASRHILLVEDDHELREALSDALTGAGHRISAVRDGSSALKVMRESLPDVVVLDLMMPVMDGWQFRVEQKRDPILAQVPVVAISASTSAVAAAVDADVYIRKPVDATTLLRAIEDVLGVRARLLHPAKNAQDERLAALGTLAAGVAHEVNNPLTYVLLHLAHASRLLATIEGEANHTVVEKLDTLLRGALDGAERIRSVTSGIRAFPRVDELARTPLDIHPVLDAALKLVSADMTQRAKLVKSYGVVPLVLANEGRLAPVFLNLLTNALQAIPEGEADAHTIHVVTGSDRLGRATIEIIDDGEGVPEHLAARIFEPFFSTRPVGQGAGLGLSISQGIVTALGGELTLQSEMGRGSTFRVALPAAYSSGTRLAAAGTTSRRVLVVDHESATGHVVRDAIGEEHDVIAVSCGLDGLDALLKVGRTFDLVFCDLDLPDISGIELWQRLHSVRPELASRLVFTSGDDDGEWTKRARSTGCRVMRKPLMPAQLRALLAKTPVLGSKTG